MAIKAPDSSFRDDSRGVSELIGFILMFAILIILLSIHQAQFVPQENSEIEFQHFQEVRNDMVEVRSSISTAGQANVSQYPTIKLGTNYPVRLFAVNPPPPAGSLETSQSYNISMINETGATANNVSTRFLVYRNGYNEMDIGPIWYEHSVLYLDERENSGGIAIYEEQNIITGNNSARVTALQNDFSVSSTGEVTLNLYPTETTSVDLSEMSGNITLKIPTRLNGSEYWDDSIGERTSDGQWEYHGTESYPDEDGIWYLNLTVKTDSLKFNTVGINSAPEDQGYASKGVGPGEGGGGGSGGNGDAASQVDYIVGSETAATWGEDRVDFKIINNGTSDVEITDIKIDSPHGSLVSLRESAGGSATAGQHEIFINSSTAAIYEASGDISAGSDPGVNAYTLGDKVSLTQNGILASGETAQATLVYFRNNGGQRTSAADKEINVTIYFSDGSELSFDFIPPGY